MLIGIFFLSRGKLTFWKHKKDFAFLAVSDTMFWLVWEAIAIFFLLWAVLVQKGYFAAHKRIQRCFHVLLAIAVIALATLCGMIGGAFVSGGKGINEPFSEAEGMSDYLIKHGIEQERIVLEDKSTNTVENIQNSKGLMEKSYNGVGIVTNNFHVFRAVQIAKVQGLEDVCGIAADSNVLYLPNNVLRECCGILKDWIMDNL